jgi:hypothetical protein
MLMVAIVNMRLFPINFQGHHLQCALPKSHFSWRYLDVNTTIANGQCIHTQSEPSECASEARSLVLRLDRVSKKIHASHYQALSIPHTFHTWYRCVH